MKTKTKNGVTKRLSPECREFIVGKLNRWPITTEDLQLACKEAGLQVPTFTQIRRVERSLYPSDLTDESHKS